MKASDESVCKVWSAVVWGASGKVEGWKGGGGSVLSEDTLRKVERKAGRQITAGTQPVEVKDGQYDRPITQAEIYGQARQVKNPRYDRAGTVTKTQRAGDRHSCRAIMPHVGIRHTHRLRQN